MFIFAIKHRQFASEIESFIELRNVDVGASLQFVCRLSSDVDECRLLRVRRSCSLPHQQCRNAVGSYMCANMCPVGYRYDAVIHYCHGTHLYEGGSAFILGQNKKNWEMLKYNGVVSCAIK